MCACVRGYILVNKEDWATNEDWCSSMRSKGDCDDLMRTGVVLGWKMGTA